MRIVYWRDLEPRSWQKFRFRWLSRLALPLCVAFGHDPFLLSEVAAYCWRCGYRLPYLDPQTKRKT